MADTAAPVESHAEELRGTPPASNPGADDATAGIAPDAGGVSGAAHKDIENPATTAQKRRSVFGSVKGLLGLDKKSTTDKSSTTASDGTYIGAATAAVTGTVAAVAEKVSTLTTGPSDGSATGAAAEKDESAAADAKDVAATESTSEPVAAAASASETPAGEVVKTTPEEAVKTDTEEQPVTTEKEEKAAEKEKITGEEANEDGEHKPPQPAHNATLTNPEAIPVAGGVKVGEEHAGESAIIPEDPLKPTAEEKAKGAQDPAEQVADNTAKNTGSATSGPGAVPGPADDKTASPSSPGGESAKDKGKGLINKLKSKIKKNKE